MASAVRKNVLVGGGTGFVGRTLCNTLNHEGFNVKLISRKAGPNSISWEQIEKEGLPGNTDAVINLSGSLILDFTRRWTKEFRDEIWNSRVKTTSILATALKRLPPLSTADKRVLICTSAIGYYPTNTGEALTEDSPKGPGFLSDLCAAIEESAGQAKDVARVAAVRPGVVYGKHGGAFASMKWPFFFGLGGPIGNGKQTTPWIHVNDLADLYAHILDTPTTHGAYNAVSPQVVSNAEFTKALAKAMNRPAIFPVPAFVLKTLLGAERAGMLLDSQIVVPKRTLESGFEFQLANIDDAVCELVRKF